jgi:hypothetical protein
MTANPLADPASPRLTAAIDLLGRTGARSFQLRYHDDEKPVVWLAVAAYERDRRELHETDAALTPLLAVERLLERLVDGGVCIHCGRPTAIETVADPGIVAEELLCWYRYDRRAQTYGRSCAN